MAYARYLTLGYVICLVVMISTALPLVQPQALSRPSVLRRIINVEANGLITYTDHYSLSKFSLVEKVQQPTLYIKLPVPYADQLVQYPSPFEFIELPTGQQNPFNITRETDGIKITASKDALALGVEGQFVNFSVRYRFFSKPIVVYSVVRNITVPLSFENNLPVDFFSINLTVPANTLIGTPNASWNFFDRLDTAEYTLLWQSPSIHSPSEFDVVTLELVMAVSQIKVLSVSKIVKFDPLAGLYVEEGYQISTDPYAAVSDLPPVLLPVGAYDVGARDLIGELKDTGIVPVANTTRSYAKVTRRIRLDMGANYTFFVTYGLPLSNYTTRKGDIVTITIPVASNYTDFAESYNLSVQLPIGAKLISIELMNSKLTDVVQQGDTYSVQEKYLTEDVIEKNLIITFSYSPLWAGYTPSMVLFTSGLVILGVYYVHTKKGGPLGEEVLEPGVALASELAHTIRKRLAIESQIEELELRYFEGQISRREFRSIHQTLRSDLDKRNAEVTNLSKRLREVSPQYANRIKTLEGLQIELRARHASLREIGFNYHNKKIPRSTYEELSSRYSGEISDVVSKIRAILEEL